MAKHKIDPDSLPSNDINPREEPPKDASPKPLALPGEVRVKKTSRIATEVRGISSYLFEDVLLPALKRVVNDFFVNGIEMALWGRSSVHRPGDRIDYGSHYQPGRPLYPPFSPIGGQRQYSRNDEQIVTDLLFSDPKAADTVLTMMAERIYQYRWCTVGDYYTFCGMPNNISALHEQYGWDDVSMARVRGDSRSGYYIQLPQPIYFRR